jgi:hypothetical protein
MKLVPYVCDVNKWVEHFRSLPTTRKYQKFYVLKEPKQKVAESNPVKLVTPTQQVVEQAKATLKRKIEDAEFPTPLVSVKKTKTIKKAAPKKAAQFSSKSRKKKVNKSQRKSKK